MTIHGDLNTGAFRLDELGVSTGEMLGASAAQAVDDMPSASLYRIQELEAAKQGDSLEAAAERMRSADSPAAAAAAMFGERPKVTKIPVADARKRVADEGLDKELKLPDEDIAEGALSIMLSRAKERHARKMTIARGPEGFVPSALSVGTSFLVQAADPLNVASAFIPVVGEVRYARALASAGESLVSRAVTRARLGAIEGAAGAAFLEPVIMGGRWHEGADYTMGDFLSSIAFGAGLGAGLHTGAGGARDIYRARRGEAQYPFGPGEALREQEVDRITKAMEADGITPPRLDLPETRPDAPDEIPRDQAPPEIGPATVHGDIRGQLKAAGLADDEADANAAIVAARYRTRASRLGVDETELYRSEGIAVRRAEPGDAIEAALADARVMNQDALKPAVRNAEEAAETLAEMSDFVRDVYGEHYPGARDFAEVIADFSGHVERGLPIDRGPVARLLEAARRIDFDRTGDDVPDAVDELVRNTGRHIYDSFRRRGGYDIGSEIGYDTGAVTRIGEALDFQRPRAVATPALDRAMRELAAVRPDIEADRYVAPKRLRDVRNALDAADRDLAQLRKAEETRRLAQDEDFEPGDPLDIDDLIDTLKALRDDLDDAAKAAEAVTFDQAGDSSPRGRITLAENRAVIELFQKADRSTFMDEASHLWLDELVRDARRADAPAQLRDDLKTALDWLGAGDGKLTAEHHEKWASAFERYLAEGRAPSEGLTRAFEQFRDWLIAIYRALANIGEDIPDGIRAVMDRMLATDEELRARPSSVMAAIEDLPGQAKQDLLAASIAALTRGEPVRAGDMTEIAARSDDRIRIALSADTTRLPPPDDGVRIVGHGENGPVLDGYQGRWSEAVAWLSRAQVGDAMGVLEHPAVPGRIDVVWGTRAYGLQHIAELHPEVVPDLPERLSRMTLSHVAQEGRPGERIVLSGPDGAAAVIRTQFDGERKTWLLTAYTPDSERRPGRGTTGSSPGEGPARSPSPPADETIKPVAPAAKAKRGPGARNEETFSLFEFLASRGGLRPDPDLGYLLDGNPFIPGFGRLIRKQGGMSLDRAREAAVEAGYIIDEGAARGGVTTSDINMLLDLVAAEARGEKQYRIGTDAPVSAHDIEKRLGQLENDMVSQFRELGIDAADIDEKIYKRTLQIMDKEGVRDADVAYERAVMEDADRYERDHARRQQDPDLADIPGWTVPDDAGAAPAQRRAAAPGRSGDVGGTEPAARQSGAGAGAGGRDDRAAFEALAARTDDPDSLAASQAADQVKTPDTLTQNARVAAAERFAAEADALYKASEPYIPDEVKRKVDADVKALTELSADRATALEQGAACLAAAVG